MIWIVYLAITIATFCLMEGVAWFTHKYIMHGLLWKLHEDHHTPHNKTIERNDFFFLLFAAPGSFLIFNGALHQHNYQFWIGLGITLYGIAYFFIHDIVIHQRLPYFKRLNHIYFKAIRKAHKVHHKNMHKEDGVCFGMLLVPFKYFKEAQQNNNSLL